MKSTSTSNVTYSGPGFFTLLGLLFIGLKLAGIINWSWWLVLLPLYGLPVLVLGIMLAVFMFAGICLFFATVMAGIAAYLDKK